MIPQIDFGSGLWLPSIGPWGDLAWSALADGGCDAASWSMNLPPTFAHPSLRRGGIVRIKAGTKNLYRGLLEQPVVNVEDDGSATWQFTAQGLSALAGGYLCLDGAGNTSTTLDTVIDAAIARGLPWKRPNSIGSVPFTATDTTDALNYLSDLLDAFAASVGERWGVDEDGNVYMAADDTTPTWYMTPGSGQFGLADDNYASSVFVRYWNGSAFVTASATDAVAAALYGAKEYAADATSYGTLTAAQATGMANGALAKGKSRLGWTNSLSPSKFQLTTPGGTPAPLWMVKPQQVVRLHGVYNEQGQPLPFVDFAIGEADHSEPDETLTISPVGLVARDVVSIISEAFGGAA